MSLKGLSSLDTWDDLTQKSIHWNIGEKDATALLISLISGIETWFVLIQNHCF